MVPTSPLLFAVVAAAVIYGRGWRRRCRHGVDGQRGEPWRFGGGLAVLLVALAPGVDELAHRSFAWHMLQHQLLILVAAPLLASSRPVMTLRAAVGERTRSAADGDGAGTTRRGPLGWPTSLALIASVVHLATVLAWHLPPLYDAAMAEPRLHHLEHLTLLGTAAVAWGAILTAGRQHGPRALAAVCGLVLNALAGAGLGVVLLSAPLPLYGWYAELGSLALDHQRVGGALMKVSAVVAYAGAAVWIVTRSLRQLSAEPTPAEPVPTRAAR